MQQCTTTLFLIAGSQWLSPEPEAEWHGAKHKEPSAQRCAPGNKGHNNQNIYILPGDKPKEQRAQPGAPGVVGPIELMAVLGPGFRSKGTKQSTQKSTKT